MLAFFGVVLGIALLIAGGTALVQGASQLATRMGISPMIIGLTIVGFGTSTPELMINIMGAASSETAIAFGNVVGSNISNLGLVLGAAALIQTIDIQSSVVRREVPLLLLITTIITVMGLDGVLEGTAPRIGRADSIILFLLFGIFLYIAIRDIVRTRNQDVLLTEINETSFVYTRSSGRFLWLLIIFGFVLLFAGGETTIRFSVQLAEQAGISKAVIGLFVVAIGTSMPELVTSVIAAMRKESDLALGNLLGSNVFNSLIVLPSSGLIGGIMIPHGGIADLVVSWLFTAALIPVFFLGNAKLNRPIGVVFLLAYFSYAAFRVVLNDH
ncbi:MAG: calcium/sodium antiporter [Xanthomonadales bacterium]|nr:calcium/sodium antiporter [Gammaproteobacteria bacterium]MBT8052923.1 calcium/sodium antiporter [Gammaproteobacteria bacterium]NND57815.1 calcium/sodium antiporter [Xanthomonadales bacterium]NNK50694.1 calcium/sodium antiporter [Xanthomonadales bacterium]